MTEDATGLDRRLTALAADGFAGTVRVDVDDETLLRKAYGLADRARGIPMTVDTRLGNASGTKTLTALAVLSLVEDGSLRLETTARSLLGPDLPLVAADVTVEHLLCHRSGIGDYLDEGADDYDENAYLMPVPVHRLATADSFLPILDGHPTKFRAGESFDYCNGGFVILALLAERASGVGYHDLLEQRVFSPAGLASTDFPRSDTLPADAAMGYVLVDGEWRSNILHLPVRGVGDGGAFTTVDDVHRLWAAILGGRIVSEAMVAEMFRPRSDWDEDGESYGLGVWLDRDLGSVEMHGSDAGISFLSLHVPGRRARLTVMANVADVAWPVAHAIVDHLGLRTDG